MAQTFRAGLQKASAGEGDKRAHVFSAGEAGGGCHGEDLVGRAGYVGAVDGGGHYARHEVCAGGCAVHEFPEGGDVCVCDTDTVQVSHSSYNQ